MKEHEKLLYVDEGKYSEGYDDGFWDILSVISAVDYGKERFFLQDDGRVYDRANGTYCKHKEEALARYIEEIDSRREDG